MNYKPQMSIKLKKTMQRSPVYFTEEYLGESLWSKEKEIMQLVAKNRKTSIGSGNAIGKTHTLARLALWFGRCYSHSKVIATAPTNRQIENQFWSELSTCYKRANKRDKRKIGGDLITKKLTFDDDWFILAFTSKEYDSVKFQGWHAPYVMVVIDEASGVSQQIWDAIMQLTMGKVVKVVATGNRVPNTPFEKTFTDPEWESMIISSYESPNLSDDEENIPGLADEEWLRGRENDWGKDSPLFLSRVLGKCPRIAEDALIPLDFLEKRKADSDEIKHENPVYMGVDVAAQGNDKTVVTLIDTEGQHVDTTSWAKKTTTQTEGKLKNIIRAYDTRKVVIDADGLGLGVYQPIADIFSNRTVPYHGASEPWNDHYANKKTEIYNWVKNALRDRDIKKIQDIDYLFADLSDMRQDVDRNGRLIVEKKKNFRKRNSNRSPDYGDSFCLAWMAKKCDSPVTGETQETLEQVETEGIDSDMQENLEVWG